ncbi:MAG: ABC transporter substrate-binding protein, partial [Ancalomicrobiaceae bacterium]|nr:ABC transporter substrate-binding protein [Ancalomicrobiaceae bacterium]
MSVRIWMTAGAVAAGLWAGPALAAGDAVTICQTLEPPVLDPTIGAAQAIREVTYGNIFEGLVAINAENRIYPKLATSWEVAADHLTYTFHLRPDVS